MKKLILIAALLALAAACTKDETQITRPVPSSRSDAVTSSSQIAGSVIIKVNEELAAALEQSGDGSIEGLGDVHFERVFPDAGEFEQRSRKAGMDLFYKVSFDKAVPSTRAVSVFAGTKGVEEVEVPRKIKKRSAIPDDPYFKWQWDLYNDKSLSIGCLMENSQYWIKKYSNEGADMNLLEVWESYTTGDPNVIVAVVDGGVDLAHPDLAANAIPAGENGSRNFAEGNYNITSDSHGTHVAGTIAAVRGNGIGVAGIAGGDFAHGQGGVRVMSCQIFGDDDDASTAETANAIKWGADHGAVISQNSWGYSADDNEDGTVSSKELSNFKKMTIPSAIKAAIDYFIQYAGCDANGNQRADSPMKGGLVVFASGNETIDYDPICAYEPVIAVSSGTPGYIPAYYSNYGSWVDICAPGGDGLYYYGDGYSNYVNTYDSKTCYDDEGPFWYSRGQIYNLYATRPLDGYDYTSYGYMSGTSMACPHISGALALIASYAGGPGFTNSECKQLLLEGADKSHLNITNHYVGPWVDVLKSIQLFGGNSTVAPSKVSGISLEAVRRSVNVSWNVPADEDDGKAFGYLILIGTDRDAVQASTPSAVRDGVSAHGFRTGSAGVGSKLTETIDGLAFSTTYYVAIYAHDTSKNYSELSDIVSVTTPDNLPPTVQKQFEGIIIYGKSNFTQMTISGYFSDPEGDPITYSLGEYDTKVAKAEIGITSIKITATGSGTTRIPVKVSDGDKTTTAEIPVLVKLNRAEPAETWPNPVEKDLTISTEDEAPTHVRIVSSSGKVVYDKTSTFSGFDPLVISMEGLAPGRYGVSVSYKGKTHKKTIVKV